MDFLISWTWVVDGEMSLGDVEKGKLAKDLCENSRVLFSVIKIPLKSNVGFKWKM
jgi:hypothetical protein